MQQAQKQENNTMQLKSKGRDKLKNQIQNQKGQGLIEYLIIVAIVAVGTLSIMRIVGQSVNIKFARIAEALGARSEGRIGETSINETSWRKKDMTNFFQNAR
jgi:Flp pilus assembly pilin Flp